MKLRYALLLPLLHTQAVGLLAGLLARLPLRNLLEVRALHLLRRLLR